VWMTEPLLFHMGVVVPLVRTRTGEGDVPAMTEPREMSGHGLAPVIRMEGEGAPRVPAQTGCQCSNHIGLCVRAYHPCLEASGAPVGDGQCPPRSLPSPALRLDPPGPRPGPQGCPREAPLALDQRARGEGPCLSERESCHPEGCSGYDRSRADGT
jgi:hypothetical protein